MDLPPSLSAFKQLELLEDELYAMLRREEELEQDAGQSQRLRQLQLITSKLQPPAQHATAAGASGPLAPAAPAPAAGSPAASQLLATTAAHQHMLQLCDALDRMDEALQAKADADGAPASPLKSQTPPRKLRPCGAKLTPNVAARQQLHVLRQNLRLLAHPSTALRLSGGGAAADVAAAAAELAGRSAGSSGGGGQPQGQGTAASRPAPASERRLNQQLLQQQGDIMQLLRLLAGDMEADAGRMAAYKRKVVDLEEEVQLLRSRQKSHAAATSAVASEAADALDLAQQESMQAQQVALQAQQECAQLREKLAGEHASSKQLKRKCVAAHRLLLGHISELNEKLAAARTQHEEAARSQQQGSQQLSDLEGQLRQSRAAEQALRHQAAKQLQAVTAAYTQEIESIRRQVKTAQHQRPSSRAAASLADDVTSTIASQAAAAARHLPAPARPPPPGAEEGTLLKMLQLQQENNALRQQLGRALMARSREERERERSCSPQRAPQPQPPPAAAPAAPPSPSQAEQVLARNLLVLKKRQDELESRCNDLTLSNISLRGELAEAKRARAAAAAAAAAEQLGSSRRLTPPASRTTTAREPWLAGSGAGDRPASRPASIKAAARAVGARAAAAAAGGGGQPVGALRSAPGRAGELGARKGAPARVGARAGSAGGVAAPAAQRRARVAAGEQVAGSSEEEEVEMEAAAAGSMWDVWEQALRSEATAAAALRRPVLAAAAAAAAGGASWAGANGSVPDSVLEWAAQYAGDEGLARPCTAAPSSMRGSGGAVEPAVPTQVAIRAAQYTSGAEGVGRPLSAPSSDRPHHSETQLGAEASAASTAPSQPLLPQQGYPLGEALRRLAGDAESERARLLGMLQLDDATDSEAPTEHELYQALRGVGTQSSFGE